MGLRQRVTGVTNVAVAITTAVTGRTPNLLSVQVVNPTAGPVTVDILDGNGATVLDTICVGPYGETVKEWAETQRLGNLSATAGNALYAKTRAAVTGGVEILAESGRV